MFGPIPRSYISTGLFDFQKPSRKKSQRKKAVKVSQPDSQKENEDRQESDESHIQQHLNAVETVETEVRTDPEEVSPTRKSPEKQVSTQDEKLKNAGESSVSAHITLSPEIDPSIAQGGEILDNHINDNSDETVNADEPAMNAIELDVMVEVEKNTENIDNEQNTVNKAASEPNSSSSSSSSSSSLSAAAAPSVAPVAPAARPPPPRAPPPPPPASSAVATPPPEER